MNQTGGFFYHYLAFRNSARYWKPFKDQISIFLENELKDSTIRNLWIGPSAGYSLPPNLMRGRVLQDKFVDIDVLAKVLFSAKFGSPNYWDTRSVFQFTNDPHESAHLSTEKLGFKEVERLVFCNILGQLPLLHTQATSEYWESFYSCLLENLSLPVISYHDLFTIVGNPKVLDKIQMEIKSELIESENQLLDFLRAYQSKDKPLSYVDHFTASLGEYRVGQTMWRKDSKSLHLIDCISTKKT